MPRLILFNKPFDVLCQFSDQQGRSTLKDYIDIPGVYPAGRLDRDSEGLVVLTDDGRLRHLIAHPRFKLAKTYLVQVENIPGETALEQLRHGVMLRDGLTRPATVKIIDPPAVWPRHPPIRQRATIPTCWLELTLREGRNRQVRRMTAHVGHPTLRLIRHAIGPWTVTGITPGLYRELTPAKIRDTLGRLPAHERLDTAHHRRHPRGKGRPLSDGRGRVGRQGRTQSAGRASRRRRNPDRGRDS